MSSLGDWAQQNNIQFAEGVGFTKSNNDEDENDDWGISFLGRGGGEGEVKVEVEEDKLTIHKGSVILSVPKKLMLSSSKVQQEFENIAGFQDALQRLEKGNFDNHKGEFLLFLKLLKEFHKGDKSLWYPWIQSLPTKFSTGVCFDQIEKDCLPPFSRALVDYECIKLQIFGNAAALLLKDETWIQRLTSTSTSTSAGDDRYDALCRWAFNVIYTRCWKFSDELDSGTSDIVPIGDLFNHHEPANVAVQNDVSSETVDFVLQSDVTSKEDVTFSLSYGLTNPHRFLAIFGFVDESMPEVFCQVVFPNPGQDHIDLGCEDRSKMVYRTNDGAISNTIWDSILYALLASQPGEQKALVEAHRNEDSTTKKALHAKYALETALTLRNHVTGTLQELDMLTNRLEEAKMDNLQHENLPLLEQQNAFLRHVFGKVAGRLIAKVETETLRRRKEMGGQE